MRSNLRVFFAALILVALGAGLASAQGPFNFQLLETQNGISNNVPNDSQIPVTTGINTQATVTVVATYVGSTAATISQKPQVLGSTEFTVAITATSLSSTNTALPIVLGPGDSFTFVVTYAPTSSAPVSAQVEIQYTEPGTTTATVQNAIILLFQGTSPAFTLFYVLHGNSIQIPSGGTIPFGATQINTTATAGLIIQNTGSGPGAITSITQPPASSPFQIAGIPPISSTGFPIAANMELNLEVLYTPTAIQNDTAQITITFLDGTKETVNLSGSGIASAYTYSYLSGTGTTSTPVPPGGTITFQPVNVATAGTTPPNSTVIVQVKNSGSASGTISSLSVSGPGFQLVTPPTTAPVLAPNGVYSFTISYTPTQVGTQTGTLVVNGSDVFTLSGQGLGSALTFSYTSSAGTIPVVPPNAVIFSPVAVSKSESVTFTLTNSGTLPTTISNIGTSSTASGANPFSLTPPPALPLTLKAGQSTQFMITFTPATTGFVNGVLQIDNTSVPLLGSGTAPPTLPSYTFTGPSGNVSPASQANISLTLANPYPVDLTGALTLTTSGNYGTDPAVQFSTGGRTVNFTIPTGSTSADFAGQGSQIAMQTGTVAETVTLAPTFTTTAGLDVTPTSPPTLQFSVAAAAPVVESLQVSNVTVSSFDLLVIGYSTTRSLTSLTVTFTPASGYNLTTSQFTLSVDQPASVWFQSSTSQTFGGLFEITVPFNLPGTIPPGKTLIQAIASAAVTVSNSVGTSSSLSTPIP
ncbi:MAG TPA: choice-of-anchor D domain-containing protein [Bryobacteraceae bacterium]|nr:choice-of-anchor D domain-containing protein [Bryobacteraceae bacterium]